MYQKIYISKLNMYFHKADMWIINKNRHTDVEGTIGAAILMDPRCSSVKLFAMPWNYEVFLKIELFITEAVRLSDYLLKIFFRDEWISLISWKNFTSLQ